MNLLFLYVLSGAITYVMWDLHAHQLIRVKKLFRYLMAFMTSQRGNPTEFKTYNWVGMCKLLSPFLVTPILRQTIMEVVLN